MLTETELQSKLIKTEAKIVHKVDELFMLTDGHTELIDALSYMLRVFIENQPKRNDDIYREVIIKGVETIQMIVKIGELSKKRGDIKSKMLANN